MTVRVQKESINLREELSSLKKPSGVAGEAMLRAETPQEQFNLIGAGRKNLIINGDFRVSQRADYSSATAITATAYRFDRWETNLTQAATIQSLDEGVRLESTASNSSGNFSFRQKVEAKGLSRTLLGSTVTLSAWVRSNCTNASLMYYTTSWGTERATHSGNGQWEKLSITFTVDTVHSHNDYCIMPQVGVDGVNSAGVSVAVGDYVEVKEVQLELGSVATPFEHRSYGEELALCQRYYEKLGSGTVYATSSGTSVQASLKFMTPKRTTSYTVGATAPIRIADGVSSPTQSSTNIVQYLRYTSGMYVNIGNFSSLTFGKVYGLYPSDEYIYVDDEL